VCRHLRAMDQCRRVEDLHAARAEHRKPFARGVENAFHGPSWDGRLITQGRRIWLVTSSEKPSFCGPAKSEFLRTGNSGVSTDSNTAANTRPARQATRYGGASRSHSRSRNLPPAGQSRATGGLMSAGGDSMRFNWPQAA